MEILCKRLEVEMDGFNTLSISILSAENTNLRLFWIAHVVVLMFAITCIKIRMIVGTVVTTSYLHTIQILVIVNVQVLVKTVENPRSGKAIQHASVHAHSSKNVLMANTSIKENVTANACRSAASLAITVEVAENYRMIRYHHLSLNTIISFKNYYYYYSIEHNWLN